MQLRSGDGAPSRERLKKLAEAIRVKRLREERQEQQQLPGGLLAFIRYFWHIIEPGRPLVEGWPLEALCLHLEAITRGELTGERTITRFLANVPPGFMKSLTLNCFWPAWEWGPMGLPHLRYLAFSYAAHLTERDNERFRDIVRSREYKEMWGHVFTLTGDGKIKVTNDKQGFKFASSVGGVGTGERSDRVLTDDPHHVAQAESETIRKKTVRWFQESMSNRLNSLRESVIVVIMQRVHENDVSGAILEEGGYTHLMIPFDYESGRHCTTSIGWTDPRSVDGETPWDERFGPEEMATFRRKVFLWAGQYQQRPAPRGGGIFKEDWWQTYEVPISGAYEFKREFVIASLDTAFKEKEENDYSALTVWVAFDDPKTHRRCIMLIDAWKKRLPMHGANVPRHVNEDERTYMRRASPHWGLVEWVNFTCSKRQIDRLLIEDSARGHDVNNEIRRVFGTRNWGVHLVPARGDKWARAHAVVDLFTDEMIYAPGEWVCPRHEKPRCPDKECPPENSVWRWRDWAEMVITDMSVFPRGAHDDIVDTASMALKHLREMGIAIRREERQFAEEELGRHRPNLKPLYIA